MEETDSSEDTAGGKRCDLFNQKTLHDSVREVRGLENHFHLPVVGSP